MGTLRCKLALIAFIFFTVACGEECLEGDSCGEDTTTGQEVHSCLVNYDKLGQKPCPVDTTTLSSGK